MRKKRSITQKPALDMIDEAVALLRRCPLWMLGLYYLGTVPFILMFLYFWADMSTGAYAQEHLSAASLGVALSFLWCKFWQALFGANLLAAASHRPQPAWTWRGTLRAAAAQAAIQPTALFVLPIAAVVTIPLAAACAFYQNASILALDGAGAPQAGAALAREATTHANRWQGQNWAGLGILLFFWLTVFFNVMIVFFVLPSLLKTLLGVETMFSRSMFSLFNTTVYAMAGGITHLCVDPLLKAFYTIRCFHGRALSTGEDLQIDIRGASATRLPAMAASLPVIAALLLCCAGIARGADAPPPPAQADTLNQSITEVLNRPEFAWRAPRVAAPEKDSSAIDAFIDGAMQTIKRWLRPFKKWGEEFAEWLARWLMKRQFDQPSPAGPGGWEGSLKIFAWGFCIVAACALGVMGWKLWQRRTPPLEVAAQPPPPAPDLASDDVTADQLPEEAWLGLARQMVEQGDYRLALRALYLAALAHLGERQIISIARHKSNRDYQREMRRRRPAQEELHTTFAGAVRDFERAWYGMHEVTPDGLAASRAHLDTIRRA